MTEDILRRIESKLSALLAISVDSFLRETELAKPRPRSIDRLLADAGLNAQEIATLLGKTDRAVNLQLAQPYPSKKSGTRRPSSRKGG